MKVPTIKLRFFLFFSPFTFGTKLVTTIDQNVDYSRVAAAKKCTHYTSYTNSLITNYESEHFRLVQLTSKLLGGKL